MKTLAWITGIIGGILMLFGLINFLTNSAFLGVNHAINYFHVANSFLLFTICFLLYPKSDKK